MPLTQKLVAALLIAGLLVPGIGYALTVTGSVDRYGEDFVVVGGTHFQVNDRTVVELLPAQQTEEGRGLQRVYDPKYLDDAGRARVEGAGRLAESIRLLPYQEEPRGEGAGKR